LNANENPPRKALQTRRHWTESDNIPGSRAMSPQSSIAHYRVVSKLGEGGMGAVYRVTAPNSIATSPSAPEKALRLHLNRNGSGQTFRKVGGRASCRGRPAPPSRRRANAARDLRPGQMLLIAEPDHFVAIKDAPWPTHVLAPGRGSRLAG
jgi:hypothetical protein